ncbi:TAXI family TRAP transporter solute-binding subunit [Vibrio sp. WJH972]
MARLIGLYAIATLSLILSHSAWSDTRFITIGTGSETGVYYPSGSALCQIVNQERGQHNLLCSIEATGGSIYNVNTLRREQFDFAIVQSDWQYHGIQGSGPFTQRGAFKEMRSVFSLYTEPFNIIAHPDNDIQSVQDLFQKRVNIGNSGSGDRATMEFVMDAFGWNKESFQLASELTGAKRSQALCEDKLDAYIYMVGHPSSSIQEAITSCDAKIVPATGQEIERIVAEHPYYTTTTIAPNTYRGQTTPIQSFGVAATLITRSNISEEVVYKLVKAIFENFEQFKNSHPALATLEKQHMIKDSLSAPLHSGAVRYYREIGIMK